MRLDLGNVPLTNADYARIRANVMAHAARGSRGTLAWRLAFAVITAALAWLAFTPAERVAAPAPGTRRVAAAASAAGSGPTASQPTEPAARDQVPVALNVLPSAAEAAAATQNIAKPRITVRGTVHPRATLAKAPQVPMRIEIQTDDPDVRIIWITNPTVEDQSS